MPINGYFDTIFAVDGDLNTIPDPAQPSGTVSYNQGFPIGYSTPVGSGGILVPRTAFNQVLNDITTAVQNWQQNTVAPFITTTMNGGTPYSYPANAMVLSGGVIYLSLVSSNTDTPPSAKWQIVSLRTRLTGNTTLYVATTGNDSTGNGTSGAPWATLQHAINYIQQNIDIAGYIVTVQLQDGTYTGGVSSASPFIGGNERNVVINGDSVTPSNTKVTVTSPSVAAFYVAGANSGFTLQNIQLKTVTGGNSIQADQGGTITVGGGMIFDSSPGAHMIATNLGRIYTSGNYSIVGSAGAHLDAVGADIINTGTSAVTLTGTPAFSTAFANSTVLSNLSFSGVTFTGSATGTRYIASVNAVIDTNGGGANYFPGSIAGSTATGAQYI